MFRNNVMHESLTKNLIGNLDGCELIQDTESTYKIFGWCGTYDDHEITSVKLCCKIKDGDAIKTDDSPSVSFNIPRADVANFYSDNKFLNTGFEIKFESNIDMIDAIIQVYYSDKWHDLFNVTDQINESVSSKFDFKIRKNASADFLVVDNFYDDPDAVRDFALKQKFTADENYHKGSRTERRFLSDETHKKFESLLNKKIDDWYAHGVNGVFQYCTAEDAVVYHYDEQTYAATIYLTPDAPPQCGTSFFRSKHNKISKVTEHEANNLGKSRSELDQEIFQTGFYDKTNLELIDVVGNVYNRLVIWNAKLIHSASEYFGNDKTNSRLFHLFFFDA